jgi:hypothetical protein
LTNTLSPTTTTPASSTCFTVTVCAVSHAPSGKAKTIVIVKIGWMTATRPRSGAIAWRIQPGIRSAIPMSHVPCPARRTNEPG